MTIEKKGEKKTSLVEVKLSEKNKLKCRKPNTSSLCCEWMWKGVL